VPQHFAGPASTDYPDETVILGVDTHNDVHVAAVISTLGVLLGTEAFPTTSIGYAALLAWARGHRCLRRAGVEGTSSHGTALTRFLRVHGVRVLEVNRPDRAVRRRRGKTDTIDAENAARGVLSGQTTAVAKSGDGTVEAIRLLKIAKDSAIKARTQAINQMRAVLVRADPQLRESLDGRSTPLIATCPRSGFDTSPGAPDADDVVWIGQDPDVGERVAVESDEVSVVPLGQHAAARGLWAEGQWAVGRRRLDRLERGHPCLDEQWQLASVPPPRVGQIAAAEGDVGAHRDGHPPARGPTRRRRRVGRRSRPS
jgi:Transposase